MKTSVAFFACFFFIFSLSCSKSSNQKSAKYENLKESFDNGTCLDAKQIEIMFQYFLAETPTRLITTNLSVQKSESQKTSSLMIYKSFGIQEQKGNQLGLVPTAFAQEACSKVTFQRPDGHTFLFKITESSLNSLSLSLDESSMENIEDIRKSAFKSLPQPLAYSFERLGSNKMQIKTTYRTVDPVCNSTETYIFQVTRLLEWKTQADGFSTLIPINPSYLEQYLNTLESPPQIEIAESLGLETIQNLEKSPMKKDLLTCE